MKKLFAIAFLLSLAVAAVAQDIPNLRSTVITNFLGMTAASETDVPPEVPVDIVDFDFRSSGSASGAGMALVKRKGYEQVGDFKSGEVGGIYRFRRKVESPQLLASIGDNLFVYNESQAAWVDASENVQADTCLCTASVDRVRSVYRKNWFGFSTQDYDTLALNGTGNWNYIDKILGDSMITLNAVWGGATGRFPCTLLTYGSLVGGAVFASATGRKQGLMFEDTLHIATPDERVEYGGGGATATATLPQFTSLGTWNAQLMQVTLSGSPGVSVGKWAQISPTANQINNIALYAVAQGANSNTFVLDSTRSAYAYLKWLKENSDSTWTYKGHSSVTYDTLLKSTITTVTKESTFVYGEPVSTVTQRAYIDGFEDNASGYRFDAVRTLYIKKRVYIFRHYVTVTSVASTPSGWPRDSLNYMTALAKVTAGNAQGVYPAQSPILIDTVGGANCFLISTYGYGLDTSGAAPSTYYDSSYWVLYNRNGFGVATYNPTSLCVNGACSQSITTFPAAMPESLQVIGATSGVERIWYIPSPAASFGCDIDSMIVRCMPGFPTMTKFASNGASESFMATDSLVIIRQARTARSPKTEGFTRDTAWHYPIIALLGGRIYGTGSQFEPNKVVWTHTNNPDTLTPHPTTNFEYVFQADGQIITAMWTDQNIVYFGKPTRIYYGPVRSDNNGFTGIYPTASGLGPLSMDGFAQTPQGVFFIAFDGIRGFDGSNSQLISAPISWFWRDSLNPSLLSQGALVYDPIKNKLIATLAKKSSVGNQQNNASLVYDFDTGLWSRYSIGALRYYALSYPTNDPTIYWGDKDNSIGAVYRFGDFTTDAGQQIRPYLRTGWLNLARQIGNREQLYEWFLESRKSEGGSVNLYVSIDGNESTANFGDTTIASLTGWNTERYPFPPHLSGERFKIILRGNNVDSLEITGLRLDHYPAGVVLPTPGN